MDRWTDDRLDDRFQALDQRITYVNGLPVKVAELTAELRAVKASNSRLERELTHEDGAVAKLTRKLEQMTAAPARRREGIVLASVGGFIGVGGGGLIVALLTGGIH